MQDAINQVTQRIRQNSAASRDAYLAQIHDAADKRPPRHGLSCGNLAHGIAACSATDKQVLSRSDTPNIGIISAYNDMLSAHQPFHSYPERIKAAAKAEGAVAQFAGGVPAMCDGITQGQDGMDLSLFSRDVIAMSTAVALSHNMFDAALCLGICDKIVPGLLIGSLAFGHLPIAFVPAGPMTSGLPNKEKARIRQEYAAGRVDREALLEAESASYHSPGTCTFYGTANSNQLLMEFMGLQLPGGSFINPGTPLRDALTDEAVRRILSLTYGGEQYTPIGHIVDEKAIVNAMVGLLATGGSTNHTLHLVAIARAAGMVVDWDDFAALSAAVPLLCRIYPNGLADVNHFQAAGGTGFLMGQLLDAGLLHDDVNTMMGHGLDRYCQEPTLADAANAGGVTWQAARKASLDLEVVRPVAQPFDKEGGLRVVAGNLGRAIVKTSAVAEPHQAIAAPARVFATQQAFVDAFNNDELGGDFVAVLPFQGPSANGMPELHKLTPYLGVLQDRGQKVALLTDGRMSGASGKVLAAIQLTPEAKQGGEISRIIDGDHIEIDAQGGKVSVNGGTPFSDRAPATATARNQQGMGRELFSVLRQSVSPAESGASIFTRNQA